MGSGGSVPLLSLPLPVFPALLFGLFFQDDFFGNRQNLTHGVIESLPFRLPFDLGRWQWFHVFACLIVTRIRWNPAEIRRNLSRVGFSSETLKRLLEFGAHLPEMVLVFDFPIAELVNHMDVHCGARFRKPDFLLRNVIIGDNAFAMQLLQSIHDLSKTAVELRKGLVNLWFHAEDGIRK